MFDKTRIDKGMYWDKGLTLVGGCTKASPGCLNCWSEDMAQRFRNQPYPFDGNIQVNWDRVGELGKGKPKAWAIWNDLYHKDVHREFIEFAFNRMYMRHDHIFMVLTKRAERMRDVHKEIGPFPDNVWAGATTENQECFDARIGDLLMTRAAVRYLSLEPLLGPINLSPCLPDVNPVIVNGRECNPASFDSLLSYMSGGPVAATGIQGHKICVNWVIIGQETGPRARPAEAKWFMDLIDQCRAANVPIFIKKAPKGVPIIRELPV